jgi:hypothetical protein
VKRPKYAIDDHVAVKHFHSSKAHLDNQAADFWGVHADYWFAKGAAEKAEDCRREQRRFRGY